MIKKKMIVNLLSALLVFITSISMASSQQVYSFSLEQAVNYAKQNSVQVKNALLDYKIQDETNNQITAQAYPQLSASGNAQDYLNIPTQLVPAQFFGGAPGTYEPIQFGTKYSVTGTVTATQLLFDGQVFVGLQARKTAMELSEKQKEVTEETIKANVEKIYYQLVVGKQQISTLTANIDRTTKLLDDTKAMFKQGFAEKLDIDKLNVQLNNLQTEKSKAQSQLDAGNSGLKFLMNLPQKDTLILTDSITENKIKGDILNPDYNYADRKEYQLLETSKKLDEFNIKRYQLSQIPKLSMIGSYSKNAQRNDFNFFNGGTNGNWYTNSYIGINLTYSIFDGFSRRSNLRIARLNLQKTDNNIEQMQASIDNDVTQARVQITNAILSMDNQKENMVLAEKVYYTTKKKFEAGVGSNQEIYNAQADLKTAQNNYYSAMYDAIIAKINYLQATGKL